MMAVARIETLRLVRDRVAISLIALVPAVQIVLFGYAINLDPKDVPIAIAGSNGPLVERAARIVGETGYFKIIGKGLPSGAAERMVAAGRALVGIELPPSLDEEGSDDAPGRARVVVDATDPGAVRPALAALESAYWRKRAAAFSVDDGASIEVDWLYNPQRRTAWTIVPGLVGVIVMISMLMLGALTLVRERERGSWEALLATPVDALDALIGKLSPYVVIGALQGMVAVGIAELLFDLPVKSGIWALLAAAPVYASANLILGFAFSALAESQMQAMQGAVFFYLPSMLLSGFMFPFQGMPSWARAIGEVLPLTHFVRAARGVLLKGEGGALVGHETWPVALFTLAAAALALALYRRRLD
jgi:ABC-2 type transport system permease protein